MTTTRAAVLWQVGEPWSIEEVELDEPRSTDVLVRMESAGMCHSDDHGQTGDMPMPLPVIGGHEGSGVVEAVGAEVSTREARATMSPPRSSPPAVAVGTARPASSTSATAERCCSTSG